VTSTVQQGEDIGELLGGPELLMLLEGPRGRRGAALLDPTLVGALIQQQTIGKVLPESGGTDRKMTATDAAICAPVLDALLARAAPLPDAEAEQALLAGFHFGAHVSEPRVLGMALEAPSYEVLRITIDISAGVRQGQLVLILPDGESAPVPDDEADESGAGPQSGPARGSLCENVLTLRAELHVNLAKLTLPLRQVSGLAIGDVLPLGVTAFDQSRVATLDGRDLGGGTLGQLDGMRAIRLEPRPLEQHHPMRRAEDREALDQPNLDADGTGTAPSASDAATAAATPALPDLPGLGGFSDIPDLPDMSDLEEPGGVGSSVLEDLPDLSVLAGLDLSAEREAG
jgi:flagellar motor switch protein FliM